MKPLARVLGIALLVATAVLLFVQLSNANLDFASVATVLPRMNPALFFAGLLASIGELALRVWRFRVILGDFGHALGLKAATVAQLMGIFAGNLSPMRVAEPLKAVLLARDHRVPLGVGVIATVLERLLDLMTLVLVLVFATVLEGDRGLPVNPAVAAILGIVFITAFLTILVLLWRGSLSGPVRKLVPRFPMLESLARAFEAAKGMVRVSKSLRWVAMSIAILLVDVLIPFALFLSLSIAVSFPAVLIVIAVGALVGVVSQVPGGLGATEIVYIFLFVQIGVPAAASVAVTLMTRLMGFYSFTVLGWILVWKSGVRAIRLNPPATPR